MAPSRGNPEQQPQDDSDLSRIPTATLQGENPPVTPSQTRRRSPNRLRPSVTREPSIQITRLPSANRPSSQRQEEDGRNRLQKSDSRSRRPQSTLGIPGTDITRQRTTGSMMAAVPEDGGESAIPSYPVASAAPAIGNEKSELPIVEPGKISGLRPPSRNLGRRIRDSTSPGKFNVGGGVRSSRQYDSNAVDLLDVIGKYHNRRRGVRCHSD